MNRIPSQPVEPLPTTTGSAVSGDRPVRVMQYLLPLSDHGAPCARATAKPDWYLVHRPCRDANQRPPSTRPGLPCVLADARCETFDDLLVQGVHELPRSLAAVAEVLAPFDDTGAAVHSATEPHDTTTPASRLITDLLVLVAELECDQARRGH